MLLLKFLDALSKPNNSKQNSVQKRTKTNAEIKKEKREKERKLWEMAEEYEEE